MLERIDDRKWRAALSDTAEAWEAAYTRTGASRPERALHAVSDDPDREPIESVLGDADGASGLSRAA